VSDEFKMLAGHIGLHDAHRQEKTTHEDSMPHTGRHSTSSLVEANGLTGHVLLLLPVSGTPKRDGSLGAIIDTKSCMLRFNFLGVIAPTQMGGTIDCRALLMKMVDNLKEGRRRLVD